MVNPGAYDFVGNELDDDCDGSVDEVDGRGMVKRFALGHLRGHCEFRSVPDAAKYSRQFEEIWERSQPCMELRRLAL